MRHKLRQLQKVLHLTYTAYLGYEAFRACRKLARRRSVRQENINRETNGFFAKCWKKIKQNDQQFQETTRMTVTKFNLLLRHLTKRLERFSNRKPINPENRLALTVIYLAHGTSVHSLAESFKMGTTTVRKVIYETCVAIYEEFAGIYLSFPKESGWKYMAKGFLEKTQMPNCVGAMDTRVVNGACPPGLYKVGLLAACNSNYLFTMAEVTRLDKKNTVCFMDNSFASQIRDAALELPEESNLPNTKSLFPYYFVANSKFPLQKHIMSPYPGDEAIFEEEHYNQRLSVAQSLIDNAFGVLISRWKILVQNINCTPMKMEQIIVAAIILHNFLILNRDKYYFPPGIVDYEENGTLMPGKWREIKENLPSQNFWTCLQPTDEGILVREKLKDYLLNYA